MRISNWVATIRRTPFSVRVCVMQWINHVCTPNEIRKWYSIRCWCGRHRCRCCCCSSPNECVTSKSWNRYFILFRSFDQLLSTSMKRWPWWWSTFGFVTDYSWVCLCVSIFRALFDSIVGPNCLSMLTRCCFRINSSRLGCFLCRSFAWDQSINGDFIEMNMCSPRLQLNTNACEAEIIFFLLKHRKTDCWEYRLMLIPDMTNLH